jgi:DNA modification methylase
MVARSFLKLPNKRTRDHSGAQVKEIAGCISFSGFLVPVVADSKGVVRAGVGRVLAADLLGLKEIPVIRLERLSEARMRAFTLADNKLAEKSRWNREALAAEFLDLPNLLLAEDLDIEMTGFSAAEIDQIVIDYDESREPADDIDPKDLKQEAVSEIGQLWLLGAHKLSCADASDIGCLKRMLGAELASAAFMDPPYNRKVADIVGRGRAKHDEFAQASGEMTKQEFTAFLESSLGAACSVSRSGAVHFVCMDWRHLPELFEASDRVYGKILNLAVWNKTNAGQGSFYRSQHEHVGIFCVGKDQHLNNVQLGRHGRSRSNVWTYAGVNSFRAGRMEDLRAHPTVKPIQLVIDALLDCTRRNDIVLDTFLGSGTTLLAAERVGRRFVGTEIEPRYVDLAIRRWQQLTGKDAVLAESGRCFDEVAEEIGGCRGG